MDAGGGSDDFELVDFAHEVLSLSETDGCESEGSADSSRAAGAIIEALEEPAPGNLQGLALGALPQFLGGLASTYTLDLDTSLVSSSTYNEGTPAPQLEDTVPSSAHADDTNNLPGSAERSDPVEEEKPVEDNTPGAAQDPTKTRSVCPSSSRTSTTSSTTNNSDNEDAACALAAIAAATLLLLVLAASSCFFNHGTGRLTASGGAFTPAPAFHTTATDSFKPAGSSAPGLSSLSSHLGYKASAEPWAVLDAAASATAAGGGRGVAAAAADDDDNDSSSRRMVEPWLHALNASSTAARRGKQGSTGVDLPTLPPKLQRVMESSVRANMSSSQRLRLHLWLLHCAARNTSSTPVGYRLQQVGVAPPASSYFEPSAKPSSAAARRGIARPIPPGLRCAAAPATLPGWLVGSVGAYHKPAAPALSITAQLAAANLTRPAVGGVVVCMHELTYMQLASFRSSMAFGAFEHAALLDNFTTNSATAHGVSVPIPTNVTRATVWLCRHHNSSSQRPSPAPPSASSKPWRKARGPQRLLAGSASPPPAAATPRMAIVRPTKPVPPLYRAPLPCLSLGGLVRMNGTALRRPQHATAQPRTVRRSPTWPNITTRHVRRSPSAWLNITTRHHQRPYGRAMAARAAKPCIWPLAFGMARWGFVAPFQQAIAGPLTLPMLLPTAVAAAVMPAAAANGSSSGVSKSTGALATGTGGLTLPMLPPIVAADEATPQPSSSSSSGSPPVGLTLPMLPPVRGPSCSKQATASGLTLPMLPPTTPTSDTFNAQPQPSTSSRKRRVLTRDRKQTWHNAEAQSSSTPGSGSMQNSSTAATRPKRAEHAKRPKRHSVRPKRRYHTATAFKQQDKVIRQYAQDSQTDAVRYKKRVKTQVGKPRVQDKYALPVRAENDKYQKARGNKYAKRGPEAVVWHSSTAAIPLPPVRATAAAAAAADVSVGPSAAIPLMPVKGKVSKLAGTAAVALPQHSTKQHVRMLQACAGKVTCSTHQAMLYGLPAAHVDAASTRGASNAQDSSTAWVTSLLTLPMLPPITPEGDGMMARAQPAAAVAGADTAAGDAAGHLYAGRTRNATSFLSGASSLEGMRTPVWASPVM